MKFHKRTRMTYWSNTKVFSWMLPYKEQKKFYTIDELMTSLNTKDPLIERVIDKVQDIVMFPIDLVHSINVHLKNKKGKTHVLSANLDEGTWYDLTYRIPVCLFTELEKFIEQEKGLEAHKWEMSLRYSEDYGISPDDAQYGKLTSQAISAIEQDTIYVWWKANKDKSDGCGEHYEKEEQEMLIRLVKIYRSLWT